MQVKGKNDVPYIYQQFFCCRDQDDTFWRATILRENIFETLFYSKKGEIWEIVRGPETNKVFRSIFSQKSGRNGGETRCDKWPLQTN